MTSTLKEVLNAVNGITLTIEEMSMKLWELAEISQVELESAAYWKDVLKQNGFTITSEGPTGVPTSFIAEYGSGKPVLGIMAEYEAFYCSSRLEIKHV